MAKRPLSGSEREPFAGARAIGKADPNERLEVSILLRRRNADALKERANKMAAGERSKTRISRESFAQEFVPIPRILRQSGTSLMITTSRS